MTVKSWDLAPLGLDLNIRRSQVIRLPTAHPHHTHMHMHSLDADAKAGSAASLLFTDDRWALSQTRWVPWSKEIFASDRIPSRWNPLEWAGIGETTKYQFSKLQEYLRGVLMFCSMIIFSHTPVLKT